MPSIFPIPNALLNTEEASPELSDIEKRRKEIADFLSKTPLERAKERSKNLFSFTERTDTKTGEKRKTTKTEKALTGANWAASLLSGLGGPGAAIPNKIFQKELANYEAVAPHLKSEQLALEATARAKMANASKEKIVKEQMDTKTYLGELKTLVDQGKLEQQTAYQAGLLTMMGKKADADALLKSELAKKTTQQTANLAATGGMTGEGANAAIASQMSPENQEAFQKTFRNMMQSKAMGNPRFLANPTQETLNPDGTISKSKTWNVFAGANPMGTVGGGTGVSNGAANSLGAGGVGAVPASEGTVTKSFTAPVEGEKQLREATQAILKSRRTGGEIPKDMQDSIINSKRAQTSGKKAVDAVSSLIAADPGVKKYFGPNGYAQFRLARLFGQDEKLNNTITQMQTELQNMTNTKAQHMRALGQRGIQFFEALDSSFPKPFESLDSQVGAMLAQTYTTQLIDMATAHPAFEDLFMTHDSRPLLKYYENQRKRVLDGKSYIPPTKEDVIRMLLTGKEPNETSTASTAAPTTTGTPKVGGTVPGIPGKIRSVKKIE